MEARVSIVRSDREGRGRRMRAFITSALADDSSVELVRELPSGKSLGSVAESRIGELEKVSEGRRVNVSRLLNRTSSDSSRGSGSSFSGDSATDVAVLVRR